MTTSILSALQRGALRRAPLSVLCAFCCVLSSIGAHQPLNAAPAVREVEVSLGGSSLFKLGIAAKKITLTDPSVAEVSIAQGGLLLIGRKVGETNLVAYNENASETYLIKVSLPARAIQSELSSLFPYERDVRARAVGRGVSFRGNRQLYRGRQSD